MSLTHANHDHHDHEQAKADREYFGFWVYIVSDCMIFATVFSVYATMSGNFAGKIRPQEVFDLWFVLIETLLLLVSSFTFGMAMLAAHARELPLLKRWLCVTFVLGAGFLGMELHEFHHLAHLGATPQASGYWTAFFTLVGTHGLHVFSGLVWMIILFFHFRRNGLDADNRSRLACLSLFWHFLDVIWICVFSFVYLMGSIA
ncbi:MAG: cytochrome o ubiquinol oxidase subunit III [Cardiobacteriaceae bacterium]|nr:cytochrome o ubiquinol oxidase subunit III [Cardiobacteriaceae bacterium]